jgi:hypothetical protein
VRFEQPSTEAELIAAIIVDIATHGHAIVPFFVAARCLIPEFIPEVFAYPACVISDETPKPQKTVMAMMTEFATDNGFKIVAGPPDRSEYHLREG